MGPNGPTRAHLDQGSPHRGTRTDPRTGQIGPPMVRTGEPVTSMDHTRTDEHEYRVTTARPSAGRAEPGRTGSEGGRPRSPCTAPGRPPSTARSLVDDRLAAPPRPLHRRPSPRRGPGRRPRLARR